MLAVDPARSNGTVPLDFTGLHERACQDELPWLNGGFSTNVVNTRGSTVGLVKTFRSS